MSESQLDPSNVRDYLSLLISEQTGDPAMVVGYVIIADTLIDTDSRVIVMNQSESLPAWMVRGMLREAGNIVDEFEDYEDAGEESTDDSDDE